MKLRLESTFPQIVECTVRDGNYAVQFQFTAEDTGYLVQELARLGFQWIEVGHGLGLGASRLPGRAMPGTDIEMIEAAAAVSGAARIGSFFIPGIGTMDDLCCAAEAGLQFVRIGQNAVEVESAYPFLGAAQDLGVIPILNVMKSYAVSPKTFAQIGVDAAKSGALALYLVDSAGGMTPDEVENYMCHTRDRCDLPLGFHGHNNLMLAVANAVAAWKSGASFIDGTLFGLGRSSGNAPTEILVALLQRAGKTTIDVFETMDFAERALGPIMKRRPLYSLLGVAAGYGKFHSSFLPKVAEQAKIHDVDIRRLIGTMGIIDPSSVDDDVLQVESARLAGTNQVVFEGPPSPLSVFSDVLKASMEETRRLLLNMEVSRSKRIASEMLVHVRGTSEEQPGMVVPEFLGEHVSFLVGRITIGDKRTFSQILALLGGKVDHILLDEAPKWCAEWFKEARSLLKGTPYTAVSEKSELRKFFHDVLFNLSLKTQASKVLVYGWDNNLAADLEDLPFIEQLFAWGPDYASEKVVQISDIHDLR